MRIDWTILTDTSPEILSRMQEAADLCVQAENLKIPCAVSVCMCDDRKIAEINKQYRNIDSSTDVLSFPTVSYPKGKTAGQCKGLLMQEYDDESSACFLGDLFISVPHMIAQAKEYGHSEIREALYLLVHGICHLMGYDHIEPEDKVKMRQTEEKILSAADASRNCTLDDRDMILVQAAREAMNNSYSPYSGYPVGAALRCADGRIITGCNVENASYGLSVCAERAAVFKAISEGEKSFDAIAIAANSCAWPCGACRQVLSEFSPDLRVLVTWGNQVEEKPLSLLLPDCFGPGSLK